METTRQIEILEKVNSLIKVDMFFRRGICDILYYLSMTEVIDELEYNVMLNLINEHRPDIDNHFIEFTDNNFWNPYPNLHNYWWETMTSSTETRQIRKDYLTKLIDFLK